MTSAQEPFYRVKTVVYTILAMVRNMHANSLCVLGDSTLSKLQVAHLHAMALEILALLGDPKCQIQLS